MTIYLTYIFLSRENRYLPTDIDVHLSLCDFQERVGSLNGGVEFLRICGFEEIENGEFLFLPREKVDITLLNAAGSELNSAIANPFFGVL